MISWHSASWRKQGETPLKSSAFLHVRCEVENGDDLAKFHRVFSRGGEAGEQSETLKLLKFPDCQEAREFGENEGFLTQTDREKEQTLLQILPSVRYLSLPVW